MNDADNAEAYLAARKAAVDAFAYVESYQDGARKGALVEASEATRKAAEEKAQGIPDYGRWSRAQHEHWIDAYHSGSHGGAIHMLNCVLENLEQAFGISQEEGNRLWEEYQSYHAAEVGG